MYLEHFRLTDNPFSLTPDTGYYYNYTSCQEAFNVVLVALESGEGIVKIVGEVGTGKTLMCRKLLNDLPVDMVSVFLPNPLMEPQQLYRAVAKELGIDAENDSAVPDLLDRLNRRLIELHDDDKRVVVCVDEAQTMPTQTLEALRLLSNVETEKRKLLQLVLFGQPELDERLSQRSLRQLRQRIGFSYRLQSLNYHGFSGYLEHRLQMAGYRGTPLFSRRAQRLLFHGSEGIPRLINILAHKALLASYGRGEQQVGVRQVRAAIADTEGVSVRWWASLSLWGVLAVSGLCIASFIVGRFFSGWM
ncbi:MAG: AAA family ATPase [Desulfuromonas sp.]|nr:AAA family ATPase [Desulfuromonas sp.]